MLPSLALLELLTLKSTAILLTSFKSLFDYFYRDDTVATK